MHTRRLAVSKVAVATVAVVTALVATACGGSDDTTATSTAEVPADAPDDATLCGVYTDEYKVILDSATPFGEEGWEDEAQELLRLAGVLEQLAPGDQAANASANVGYFQALADVESASEFIEGSNAFNLYLIETCLT